MVDQKEVDVVRGPAHDEDGDHHRKHGHDPLLVLPALVEGCWRYEDQLEDGLVSPVEVETHLGVADGHPHGGEDVGGQEEAEIVS